MNRNNLLLKRDFAVSSLALALGLVAVVLLTTAPVAMADSFDNSSGDGLFSNPLNWVLDAVPTGIEQAEMFTSGLASALPNVGGFPTIKFGTGTQSPTRIKLGGDSTTGIGDIQFLMEAGTLNLNTDSLIGIGGDDPNAVNNLVLFNQKGGDVIVTGGTGVDIKLGSENEVAVPAVTYRISGGSVSSTGTLNYARPSAPPGGEIRFEIVGTGPSSVSFADIKMETGVTRTQTLSFVLDAGGVTPLTVTDEFQMESISLALSLSAVPPSTPIVLVQADRLSNDNQFVGLPENSTVSANFGSNMYTWNINYIDGSVGGLLDNAATLSNLVITPLSGTPGDFDGDGVVDGHDFLVWQRNTSVGLLSDWQANYGTPQTATIGVVPEPGSTLLLSTAMLALIGRRRGLTRGAEKRLRGMSSL